MFHVKVVAVFGSGTLPDPLAVDVRKYEKFPESSLDGFQASAALNGVFAVTRKLAGGLGGLRSRITAALRADDSRSLAGAELSSDPQPLSAATPTAVMTSVTKRRDGCR